ncbi:hypothetical protein [Enterococcus casseliflavus]|uniref:hypothetical protein n=1 Tax=Enterococcus TaxID=1350 RepID=UPI00163BEECD|nr:hypothetical protein [Enterococcus casseliflavus]MBZ0323296.1 hypothetical protein [Enterococcus casseliflavus]
MGVEKPPMSFVTCLTNGGTCLFVAGNHGKMKTNQEQATIGCSWLVFIGVHF